jgi:hypothetical protein
MARIVKVLGGKAKRNKWLRYAETMECVVKPWLGKEVVTTLTYVNHAWISIHGYDIDTHVAEANYRVAVANGLIVEDDDDN